MVTFWLLLALLAVERLIELRLASSNFKRLIDRGGVEYGRAHYPWIVALHAGFFISLVSEYFVRRPSLPAYWPIVAALFVLAQLLRVWVLTTMSERWTTRIVVVPHEKLISRGPYRFLTHPNYVAVALEILSVPIIFGLYWTAIVFTLANAALLLFVRIPEEERALNAYARHLPSSQ
jgi:methyltransferase